jgi:peptide/nickel transport system substrate-binding protein
VVVCDDVTPPPSLDPRHVFSDKGHNIIQQIFDGLVQFGPEGNIEPALAVSWEQINPLTMRFHLRAGVRFHNGEPCDAEAVRGTLAQILDPQTNFPGLGFIQTIEKAVVADSGTIDIVTRMPDSLLLRRLAAFVFIIPQVASQTPEFGMHPVGTGPYRFESWDNKDGIRLSRNPDYWLQRASAPDGLQFRFIPTEKQLAMLLNGELDLLTELPGTATLQVASNPKTKVFKKAVLYTVATTFNTSRNPLQDVRVRQAMNYAINREELVRFDLLGNGYAVASLSMPGEVGYNPNLRPYKYDPEKARQLLKETGLPLPIRLKTLTKAQGDRTARIIAKQLKAVGIELDIFGVTTDADAIRDLASKDMDIGIAALPDGMGHIIFLQSIYLYSRSPFSLEKDPVYDRRLEAVVAELDPVKHEQMAQELDRYVHDEALSLFTYQRIRTYGVARDINFVASLTGRLYLYRIDIEAPRKIHTKRAHPS